MHPAESILGILIKIIRYRSTLFQHPDLAGSPISNLQEVINIKKDWKTKKNKFLLFIRAENRY